MLRKITDGESLEISQKKVYDGVSFTKFTNLQSSECNFAIKRTQRRYFLEYVPKTSKLIKLQHCSTQPPILSKNGAHVRSSCRNVEGSNLFTCKRLWWRLFSLMLKVLEFIPVFPYGFITVALFNYQEIFYEISLRIIF